MIYAGLNVECGIDCKMNIGFDLLLTRAIITCLAAGSPSAIEEPDFDYLSKPFIACSFRNSCTMLQSR
jgi:hypothetical protein